MADITATILAEYRAEFDDDDGVMHDVYFALAKAEWMCCEQSDYVLNRVTKIIKSGANIEFYRELEATEKDLKVRERNLEKFLKDKNFNKKLNEVNFDDYYNFVISNPINLPNILST